MSGSAVPPVGNEPPVWAPLVRALHEQLHSHQLSDLLETLQVLDGYPYTLRLRIPRSRLDPWLREGLLLRLEALVSSLSGGRCALALIPADDATDGEGDPTQTLDRFVTGPSNEKSVAAARTPLWRTRSQYTR